MTLSIDTMFAFIAVDDEGEGITGFKSPMGWMPMVGADMDRVEQFKPLAQQLSNTSGKRIVIAQFTTREDLEILEPDGSGGSDEMHVIDFQSSNGPDMAP